MRDVTGSELRVRPARDGDADAVAALARQLGYEDVVPAFDERLRRLSSDTDQLVLVAETGEGEVVGWIHMFVREGLLHARYAEIGGLIVDAQLRGRGIGRMLMGSAEAWAEARACRTIRVRSNVKRADAPAFYAAEGYAEIKQQRVLAKSL